MFLSGVALQVLLAFVNKTVMWVCDYGDTNEEFKKTCRYNLSACVSKQYWIDFLMDLMSLALFAYATVLVFNKLTK
jgi:hypothetical protein